MQTPVNKVAATQSYDYAAAGSFYMKARGYQIAPQGFKPDFIPRSL